MGVCLQAAVVAAATSARARRIRLAKYRAARSAVGVPVSQSSVPAALEVAVHRQSGRQQLCRFRHRWRRPSRLSAAVPSSVAAPAAASSRSAASDCAPAAASAAQCPESADRSRWSLPEEGINCGRESTSVAECPSSSPSYRLDSLESSLETFGSPVLKTPNDSFQFLSATSSIYEEGAASVQVTEYGSVAMDSPPFYGKHLQGGGPSSPGEERLKRRLRFFFLNPVQKWAATRRFPFKLFIQITKIFFVTVQLCLFASFRDSHVFYAKNTEVAFSHIFLQDWTRDLDVTREAPPYPPSSGPLAVYTREQFYQYFDFAVQNYATLQESTMGAYFRTRNAKGSWMTYCQTDFIQSQFEPQGDEYAFDSHTKQICLDIPLAEGDMSNFTSEAFLRDGNVSVSGSSLVEAVLLFSVKAVHFKPSGPINSPDCYLFDLRLGFDNQGQDGQLLVTLASETQHVSCHGSVNPPVSDAPSKNLRSSINILVIITCLFSFVLCARAVIKAQLLKWETNEFFVRHFRRHLSKHDQLEFLNLWYVLIIINDVLLVTGSVIKELMENKHVESDLWDVCSLLLGTGNLFVWFGVLRYLGFFRTYNMLIVTLKKAFPSVLRFLLCALLIYAGFTFCGWLVFGPYHFKFQTISSTSECLFSLVNGDDMFATFAGMSERSMLVWWFSRLYLYSFISLFIYVVLSLFIALIMDTYETIKMYYTEGFPKSDLRQFIANDECVDGSIPVYEPQSCFPVLSRLFSRWAGTGRTDYGTVRHEDDDERRPILA